jgi:hypothetical protein
MSNKKEKICNEISYSTYMVAAAGNNIAYSYPLAAGKKQAFQKSTG